MAKVQQGDWLGLVAKMRHTAAEVTIDTILHPGTNGGSGAFLARCDDGERYWIKSMQNGHGPRVPITEQVVARVGKLIGAPTCEVRTATISSELVGWQPRCGQPLEQGIAHASRAVERCFEVRALESRSKDENSLRHLRIMALHDWCWGGDQQWLMHTADDSAFYSHDHGYFLPPEGPTWSESTLLAAASEPHELADSGNGISKEQVQSVALLLKSVTRGQIAAALRFVPASWPVSDDELECLGYFLEVRAPDVADRLEQRFRGAR